MGQKWPAVPRFLFCLPNASSQRNDKPVRTLALGGGTRPVYPGWAKCLPFWEFASILSRIWLVVATETLYLLCWPFFAFQKKRFKLLENFSMLFCFIFFFLCCLFVYSVNIFSVYSAGVFSVYSAGVFSVYSASVFFEYAATAQLVLKILSISRLFWPSWVWLVSLSFLSFE